MSDYKQSIQLPVFEKLKELCETLRDGTVVPMRDSLIEIRRQLECERYRLERVADAQRPLKEADGRPIEPRAGGEGDTCPVSARSAAPRGL